MPQSALRTVPMFRRSKRVSTGGVAVAVLWPPNRAASIDYRRGVCCWTACVRRRWWPVFVGYIYKSALTAVHVAPVLASCCRPHQCLVSEKHTRQGSRAGAWGLVLRGCWRRQWPPPGAPQRATTASSRFSNGLSKPPCASCGQPPQVKLEDSVVRI